MPRKHKAAQAPVCPGCHFDPEAFGEIKGTLKAIREDQHLHGEKLDRVDARLRKVENGSAVSGALSGIVAAIGVHLAAFWLRGKA